MVTNKVVVLASPGPVEPGGNPFIRLLYGAVGEDVEVVDFSWTRAVLGKSYNILHLHWPEYVIRTDFWLSRAIKFILFASLPAIVRIRGAKSIWTVHNLKPHEDRGRLERWAIRRWTMSASARIYLTHHAVKDDAKGIVIPHGDYFPIVDPVLDTLKEPDFEFTRVLLFGVLRPIKGIEEVMSQVAPRLGPKMSLRIVGNPVSEEFRGTLEKLGEEYPYTDLIFGQPSDEELIEEIVQSAVVLLPYRRLYNSGALFMALSCGRPVVVPRTSTTEEIAREVGEEWVGLYDGEDPEAVICALNSVLSRPRHDRPCFQARSWPVIGQRYSAVYRSVAQMDS